MSEYREKGGLRLPFFLPLLLVIDDCFVSEIERLHFACALQGVKVYCPIRYVVLLPSIGQHDSLITYSRENKKGRQFKTDGPSAIKYDLLIT
jgi:hypothetical protein